MWYTHTTERSKKRWLKKSDQEPPDRTFTSILVARPTVRPFDRTVPRYSKGTARGQSTGCIDFLPRVCRHCLFFLPISLFLFLSFIPPSFFCPFRLFDRKCITVCAMAWTRMRAERTTPGRGMYFRLLQCVALWHWSLGFTARLSSAFQRE